MTDIGAARTSPFSSVELLLLCFIFQDMRSNPGAVALPLIVVIIIAYLGTGGWLLVSGRGPSTSGGPCSASYPAALGSQLIPVLVLQSGGSGEICVTYTNIEGNQMTDQRVYTGVYAVTNPPPMVFTTVGPSSISVIPSPNSVSFTQGDRTESMEVVFKVSVAPNVTHGIYGLFLFQFCTLLPMVVGSSQVGLTSSDFSSWYPHTGSCPAQYLDAHITGVSGFRVIYGSGS